MQLISGTLNCLGLGGSGKLEEDVIPDMLSGVCDVSIAPLSAHANTLIHHQPCQDLHNAYVKNVYSPDAVRAQNTSHLGG